MKSNNIRQIIFNIVVSFILIILILDSIKDYKFGTELLKADNEMLKTDNFILDSIVGLYEDDVAAKKKLLEEIHSYDLSDSTSNPVYIRQ